MSGTGNSTQTEELADVPAESIEALLAHAEKMIDGQIDLGIAIDQKATTLLGAFGAVGVALGGAAATMAAANAVTFHKTITACTVSGAIVLISVLCFVKAALPADFHVAGHEPNLMAPSSVDRALMLRRIAASLQPRIASNRDSLKLSGLWIKRGVAFAGLAILFGILAYFAA